MTETVLPLIVKTVHLLPRVRLTCSEPLASTHLDTQGAVSNATRDEKEIRASFAQVWSAARVRVTEVRDVVAHQTTDDGRRTPRGGAIGSGHGHRV